MKKIKLKKGDSVVVKSGRRDDQGKIGKIIKLLPEKNRVVVEKARMVKEYVRPNPQKNIQGGIVEIEGGIPVSNVMFYCKECEQGVRIGYKLSDNTKHRVCKKCGVVID